jgi:anaerobic selenocysteine-containing dehydrogenase
LADKLEVNTGDMLRIVSPYDEAGVEACAQVTRRIGVFVYKAEQYNVASVTLFGEEDPGVNALTSPAFDRTNGGMEIKVFMGRIEKAES